MNKLFVDEKGTKISPKTNATAMVGKVPGRVYASAAELTNAGKNYVGGYFLPSGTQVEYSTSTTSFQAPCDGWVYVRMYITANTAVYLEINTSSGCRKGVYPYKNYQSTVDVLCPAGQGQTVTIGKSGTIQFIKFIKARGVVE